MTQSLNLSSYLGSFLFKRDSLQGGFKGLEITPNSKN